MNTTPLISILVPTYNRVQYLKECLESIVIQVGFCKNSELELVISDNSESNDTAIFVGKFISQNTNFPITYIRNNTNIGMVPNWNQLLNVKKGKYFIFLSDDDKFYYESSLINIFKKLQEYNLDVAYGPYFNVDGNGQITGIFKTHALRIKNDAPYYNSMKEEIFNSSIFFGGNLYKDYGFRYNENYGMAADWAFNVLYLEKNKKVALVNTPVFLYRIHPKQAYFSFKMRNDVLFVFLALIKKNNINIFNYKIFQKLFFCIFGYFVFFYKKGRAILSFNLSRVKKHIF